MVIFRRMVFHVDMHFLLFFLRDYVPYFFTTQAWKQSYITNLSPISIENLEDMERPKIQRLEKGTQRKLLKAQANLYNDDTIIPSSGCGSQLVENMDIIKLLVKIYSFFIFYHI